MPTEKGLSNLIINKVESKEVYNYMVANNLVNEDEMYLVQGDDEVQIIVDSALSTTSENPVQNKVVATAINNLNTLVGDTPVSDQINTAVASKADASDLTAHTGNSNIHITSTERTNWNAAKAHADSAHAPSNAEENQNAFSNIIVGGTTIAADAKTDTLTIVAGNNVTLTPDATNDKLTITAKDTVYTHPTYTERGAGLYKVTVNRTGHVSEVTSVVKDDIVALGIPAQDTTYNEVTTSAAGLMSASDKTKLNGIADGANKTIVDSALSSTSTNPVQNKAVNIAINSLNTLIGDKSVASQITSAIDALDLDSTYIAVTQKGAANGVAELDSNGKVPSTQLPSYVDDVLEYTAKSNFPSTGEAGKIYVDTSTNLTYRWGGSTYTEISPSIALGTTSSTAFRGDYGNTAYIHANAKGSAFTSGLYKITTNAQGHVTAATAVVKSDITDLGIPAQDTTYSTVTTSADGLMSAADKSKLDGIATGANKTTVDSTLSSTSTNPVQNKVVNTAISALNTLVGDTPVATQITSAINDAGFLTVDLNDTESGIAPFTNSDMLGGLPASNYLQVADFPQALTDAGVVKSIAGKMPNANGEITLVPADIGAATSEHTHDYVPTSRTVNGKALSSDISLTYSDVGAAAASHTHDSIVSPDCLALTWSGDHMLSSTDRPSQKLHFGDTTLYRYNSSNNSYYPIYDNGNLTFSLSGTTLTITKS